MKNSNTKKADVLDKKIKDLQLEKGKLLREAALKECPFSVGDTAEHPAIYHNSKTVAVERISWKSSGLYSLRDDSHNFQWVVQGSFLKKNGEVGQRTTTFTEGEYLQAQAAKENHKR